MTNSVAPPITSPADAAWVSPAIPATPPVPAGPAPLTIEQFQLALPDKLRKTVSQELIDKVNATLSDPEMYEAYRENLLSYGQVMRDGRWTVQEYLSAVKYVSHKLMGATNIDAYSKTFPEKIARFNAQSVVSKDIASYVTAYNKSKLVNTIYEQTLIPVHVLNMDMYQKALNAQFILGTTATSEKVRSDALNSVLTQLRPPEVKKVELAISTKEDSSIDLLRRATTDLARQQRELLTAGVATAQEIAHQRVVPAEVVDVVSKVVS